MFLAMRERVCFTTIQVSESPTKYPLYNIKRESWFEKAVFQLFLKFYHDNPGVLEVVNISNMDTRSASLLNREAHALAIGEHSIPACRVGEIKKRFNDCGWLSHRPSSTFMNGMRLQKPPHSLRIS